MTVTHRNLIRYYRMFSLHNHQWHICIYKQALLRSSKDVSILGAGKTNCWGIYNWHQTFNIILQYSIKQFFISFLYAHYIDVSKIKHSK